MELTVFKDYNALSDHTADMIIDLVKKKPNAVICVASGDTPKLTCNLVAKKAAETKTDFSKATFVGLDEWVGIPPENEGSCQYFLRTNLFNPLGIAEHQVHLFDVMSNDLAGECRKMDNVIFSKGGIDLILVGVGMNGHIGFNEPGVPVDLYAHVVDLDETTLTVGQKYFQQQTALKQGITLGLKHLMESRTAIMIANGEKKADVIRKAVEGEITTSMPASIMRTHANGYVLVDEGAASRLAKKRV